MSLSRAAPPNRLLHVLRPAVLATSAIAAGCSASARPIVSTSPESGCAIGAQAASPPESITVAMASAIDAAHAPLATSAAERFAFAQAYETLVNVDCSGRVYTGLARSWTFDATKTRVTLTLRDDARFWTGEPLGARDVVAAWQATATGSTDAADLARRIAAATTVLDDRTLMVSLPDTAWRLLAEPSLSVYRGANGAGWPTGTGRYRFSDAPTTDAGGTLRMAPVEPSTEPRLVVRTRVSADLRDAIDAGADLLPEAGPAAVSYAASRAPLAVVTLPWQQTYVLAIPSFVDRDTIALAPVMGNDAAVLASVARDAIRADARAAQPSYWWSDIQSCEFSQSRGAPKAGAERRPIRIAYDATDDIARGLAERVVGLSSRAVSLPLTTHDFVRALHDGSEPAYVVALPHTSVAPCHDAAMLLAAAPWLRPAIGGAALLPAAKIIPLVDTRTRAIVDRDRVSTTIDWDGTLRITPARRP